MKNKAYQLALSAISPMLASMVMCFFIVSILGNFLKNTTGIIMIQIIQLVVFILMLYLPFYRWGLDSRRNAEGIEAPDDFSKGVRAGLMLSLILYCSVILLILMKLQLIPDMVFLYKIFNPQFTGILHFMIPKSTIGQVGKYQIIYAVLLPLMIPMITGSAYYIGSKASNRAPSPFL